MICFRKHLFPPLLAACGPGLLPGLLLGLVLAGLWPVSGYAVQTVVAGNKDECRALPNNPAPPERRAPFTVLPPLPPSEEGTIRRVNVGERKVMALTFDLCELAVVTTGYDAGIVDFLREKRIPATLFMGGKWMRTHRERVLEVMADPLFEIGNHAWTHGNFGIMAEKTMLEQVRWTQAQYELLREELTGPARNSVPPCPTLFRLPYGRCSDAALRLLAREGLRVIQWDSLGEPDADNAGPGVARRVAAQIRPGSIILYHANKKPRGSLDSLQRLVARLEADGYSFVSVSTLLQMGEPVRTRNGYFSTPGDNLSLDAQFGVDGTGIRRK